MNKIKILIADDVEETRGVIKKLLNMEEELFEVVGEASNGQEVVKLLERTKADVVLMDINMPVLNGLETTEIITNWYPDTLVIIMSVQSENEYLKKAMFHGAKEYVIKPFNYETLIGTIKSTYEKYKSRQTNASETNKISRRIAKKIAFFSPKGGTGKSMLALNCAITLSREISKKTLLVDLDLLFGDISMLVNQYKQKNIMDAIEEGLLESYEDLKPYLFSYSDKLDILFAPEKPEAAEFINKENIERIIRGLEHSYDYIVMDTATNFNDITLYGLDIADKVVLISTNEIVSLKNSKIGLGVMQSLGYEADKVKLVINRFTTEYGINKAEVDEAFPNIVAGMIPEDMHAVSLSVNKGKPLCEDAKYAKSKIGKAILGLCVELDNDLR